MQQAERLGSACCRSVDIAAILLPLLLLLQPLLLAMLLLLCMLSLQAVSAKSQKALQRAYATNKLYC